MKKILTQIAILLALPLVGAQAQEINIDFDSYVADTAPDRTEWQSRWEADAPEGDPTQRNLWKTSANGRDGGQGFALDVKTAHRMNVTMYQTGITAPAGKSLQIKADVQFVAKKEAPSIPNTSFIGVRIHTVPEWWRDQGKAQGFYLARKDESALSVFDPSLKGPPTFGFGGPVANTTVESPDAPNDDPDTWTSKWVTLTMTLTDNGTTYQGSCTLECDGEVLYTSQEPWDTEIPVGTEIFGGLDNGFDTAPDGTSTAQAAGVTSVTVDNFSLKVLD